MTEAGIPAGAQKLHYVVYTHKNDWAIQTSGGYDIGFYFKNTADLNTALNQLGSKGYSIPNIAIVYEEFPLGQGKAHGFRIRNGGAPSAAGSLDSVVVAVCRL